MLLTVAFSPRYVCSVARPGAQISSWNFLRATGRISYALIRNRFCENIDRFHKSNRIMVQCDLSRGCWVQTCFDHDCRADNYRSKVAFPSPRTQ